MDVDDSAVDLSVRSLPPELSELRALTASGLTITPAQPPPHGASGKRVLRPRSEQRSYAESPDIVLLPAAPPHRKQPAPSPAPFTDVSSKLNAGAVNVSITAHAPESPREPRPEEEEDDENEPPLPEALPQHRELSSAEIWERERRLRELREKLRAEETRLVLLRKIRQSQLATAAPPAKEPGSGTALAGSGCVVPPGVTVTPAPPPAHQNKRTTSSASSSLVPGGGSSRRMSSLPGGATLTPGPYRSQSSTSGGASITPSVTITPAPPPASQHASSKASTRSSEDTQTPAQRQAAAKLALRKQLEKTLLQIPPPKPPPPEMNFIPSPSNTDFVYLVGLEHVVDYLTNEDRMPRSSVPAVCAQCGCDFTPVWRWERAPGRRLDATFTPPHAAPAPARRLCELCVSGNVKRALKVGPRVSTQQLPAVCAQCGCDFTPVWRWERAPGRRLDATFTPPHAAPAPARRLCELCVSGNVKRALKVGPRVSTQQLPAVCAQCGCDFTPVWRWERAPGRRLDATFTPPHAAPAPARRLCELCVSGNVKRALKVGPRVSTQQLPAVCAQCGCDFTPVWRWERAPGRRLDATFTPPHAAPAPARRLCELCVSGNVKRALKVGPRVSTQQLPAVCAQCGCDFTPVWRWERAPGRRLDATFTPPHAAPAPARRLCELCVSGNVKRALKVGPRVSTQQLPAVCAQCGCDFTPVWRWERAPGRRLDATFTPPHAAPAPARRLCELCVSGNVKRALKIGPRVSTQQLPAVCAQCGCDFTPVWRWERAPGRRLDATFTPPHAAPAPARRLCELCVSGNVKRALKVGPRVSTQQLPAVCAQCGCDFTPVWRWERAPGRRLDATFTPPHAAPAPARRLCELCVSGNVKRALKVGPRVSTQQLPAVCAQCGCDFTPVWRWERAPGRRLDATFTPPHAAPAPARRLCELCVSGNVKRALKVGPRVSTQQLPAVCAQCGCDFTPVWRWERAPGRRLDATFTPPHAAPAPARRLCELCVSGNVKRALKVGPRVSTQQLPAVCAQCGCDFTPVWRWERAPGRRLDATFTPPHAAPAPARRLCELCVSGNVKRALKAEHTARLKTAFVRALQQEQEIERRLAAPLPAASPPPAPPPAHAAHRPAVKPRKPLEVESKISSGRHSPGLHVKPRKPLEVESKISSGRHSPGLHVSMSVGRGSRAAPSPAPPAPPSPAPPKQHAPAPRPMSSSESLRSHHSERTRGDAGEVPAKKGKGSSSSSTGQGSSSKQHQLAAAAAAQMAFEQHSAAAMQALQHQLLRGLGGGAGGGGGAGMSAAAAAAMMQFSPLLYTYQLAMAQASALAGKGGSNSNAAMAAEMQRMAEAQRQYLLDMIPGQHGRNPWPGKN